MANVLHSRNGKKPYWKGIVMSKNYLNAKTVALTLACLCALTVCCHYNAVALASTNYGSTVSFKDPDEAAADAAVAVDADDEDSPANVFINVLQRELDKMVQSDDVESLSFLSNFLVAAVKDDDEDRIDDLAYAIDRILKDAINRTVARTLVRYDAEELMESRKNVRFVSETLSLEIMKGFVNNFENYYNNAQRINDSNYNARLLKALCVELFSSKAREVTDKAVKVSMFEHAMVVKSLGFLLIECADDDDIDVENKTVVAYTLDTIVEHTVFDDEEMRDSIMNVSGRK